MTNFDPSHSAFADELLERFQINDQICEACAELKLQDCKLEKEMEKDAEAWKAKREEQAKEAMRLHFLAQSAALAERKVEREERMIRIYTGALIIASIIFAWAVGVLLAAWSENLK